MPGPGSTLSTNPIPSLGASSGTIATGTTTAGTSTTGATTGTPVIIPTGGPTFPVDKVPPIRSSTAVVSHIGDLISGVYGGSKKQIGVVGESEAYIGVSGDGPNTGVYGNSDGGDGVYGSGRRGVVGESRDFQGVFGKSKANAGVVGESDKLHGVYGVCHNPNGGGVFGTNDKGGVGVIGVSDSGIGVSGKGGLLAARFEGDVEVTGDIRLANADCAEDFDIADGVGIAPGTVMVLGDEGALYECCQPYDKRVAGVISGAGDYKPGIVLDKRESPHKRQPLALLGKVYCKVDAQYGSVEVGDLLTTSATAGHAMKVSEPLRAFGTVIGKALCPLEEGQGLVPILIALQ